MSETVLVALITFIGSSSVTALVAAYISRRRTAANTRKTDAESEAIELDTRRSEVAYYQDQLTRTIAKMEALEALVKKLQAAITDAQNKYEQRVGQLHDEIRNMAADLDRANRNLDIANRNLDIANETIGQLRQEVKDGNVIITELRSEITQLLVDREKKKGE